MGYVQVVIGRCPTCNGTTESADGLKGLFCGRGHEPAQYLPADAYYEDARKAWAD